MKCDRTNERCLILSVWLVVLLRLSDNEQKIYTRMECKVSIIDELRSKYNKSIS